MERDDVHSLIAAYALDALEGDEEAVYEAHLARCASCRQELASFRDTAALLAYGVATAPPPPELRERILQQARAERSNVVPLPRRWAVRATAAVAAVAACAAIGVGWWALSLSSQLEREREARAEEEQALAVVLDPGADTFRVRGAAGTLVVAEGGQAALVLQGLEPPPPGNVYTAWVSADGDQMVPAGTFTAGTERSVVRLTRPVPEGGLVAVTVEADEDAQEPTGDPIMVAETA